MIYEWLTVRDYGRAKRAATEMIIQKQSRGSIPAQSGEAMSKRDLDSASHRSDKSLRRLKKAVEGYH